MDIETLQKFSSETAESARKLIDSWNKRTDFVKEYLQYVRDEVKKNASGEKKELWIDSPETRRKKLENLDIAEEDRQDVAGALPITISGQNSRKKKLKSSSKNGNGDSGTSKKKRGAAKKAMKKIAAGTQLMKQTKLRRPTEGDENSSERSNDSKSSTSYLSETDENDNDDTLKATDSPNSGTDVDMFETLGKEEKISPKASSNSNSNNNNNNNGISESSNLIKDEKLKMEPIVVIERILLTEQQNIVAIESNNSNERSKIAESINSVQTQIRSLNKTENNEPCSSNTNLIINNKTFVTKNVNNEISKTNETNVTNKVSNETYVTNNEINVIKEGNTERKSSTSNNLQNEENLSDSISNEKTLKISEPSGSSTHHEINEECRIVQEIEIMTTETPHSEIATIEKPSTPVQSARKEDMNSEEQSRGRSRTRVKVEANEVTDSARSIRRIPTYRSQSASSERKVLTGGRSVTMKNRMPSPAFGKTIPATSSKVPLKATPRQTPAAEVEKKRKEEEFRKRKQKEEEALKNREELIKAKTEELRRKREMKTQKVFATREAVEKEKSAILAKMEKEKEEKERIKRLEMEKAKEELLKKKMLHQQKLQEAEERRIREENARLKRLKEQEEEQRKLAELKQKQQEEAEKLAQRRLAEGGNIRKEENKNEKQTATSKLKNKEKDGTNSYEMTPEKRVLKEPLDEDNYGIDDLQLEDSEDEDYPRKKIPNWARKPERMRTLKIQSYIPDSLITQYFSCPSKSPCLKEFFGKYTRERARTSSAIWNTPPILSKK